MHISRSLIYIGYVYIHTNISLSFRIWQYSEFDTVYVNSLFCLGLILNVFRLRCVICRYYSGFRSILWTFIHGIQNMRLSRGFYRSLRHMASCLFTPVQAKWNTGAGRQTEERNERRVESCSGWAGKTEPASPRRGWRGLVIILTHGDGSVWCTKNTQQCGKHGTA